MMYPVENDVSFAAKFSRHFTNLHSSRASITLPCRLCRKFLHLHKKMKSTYSWQLFAFQTSRLKQKNMYIYHGSQCHCCLHPNVDPDLSLRLFSSWDQQTPGLAFWQCSVTNDLQFFVSMSCTKVRSAWQNHHNKEGERVPALVAMTIQSNSDDLFGASTSADCCSPGFITVCCSAPAFWTPHKKLLHKTCGQLDNHKPLALLNKGKHAPPPQYLFLQQGSASKSCSKTSGNSFNCARQGYAVDVVRVGLCQESIWGHNF